MVEGSAPRTRRSSPARARVPLAARKLIARREARRRVRAWTRKGLSAAQRAHDPLARPRSRLGRLGHGALALFGSAALHIAVVVFGFVLGGIQIGRKQDGHQEVEVQVRERKVEPPPKPPEPPVRVPPRVVVPTPATPPPPPVKAPPPRVVGISFESTTDGSGGPSFAVGNTREGVTAQTAVAPKDVAPVAPPESAAPVNETASRIPTAGVKYVLPKPKYRRKPVYPEIMKAQGIEADVTVMFTLDATGKVIKVKVIKEAPYPEFNEAARAVAEAEEFEPATRDGVAIPYSLSFTYRFRMEDQ